MSVQACAELVRKGDPDRFLATMAAPPEARAVLFPLYALNLEVARAPWVTAEPMIAQMRQQFWRDVLEDIAEGRPPRAHEVAVPLAEMLSPEAARLLDGLVAARMRDAARESFEDGEDFAGYIDATSGHLAWAAAMTLGATAEAEPVVRDHAWASGLANYLRAIPELEASGRHPLPDGRPEAVAELAQEGLRRLKRARAGRGLVPKPAAPALYAGWQACAVLAQAAREPARVAAGALGLSPARTRARLIWVAFSGRW